VLSRAHRLTSAEAFRRAVRDGRRAGTRALVVHLDVPTPALATPPTVGFVVSKAVGGAVARNRVRRRLRHLAAARLNRLAGGSTLVVRALPPAATATYVELGADLDKCLARVAA
jgi:ribonuclease P protein component